MYRINALVSVYFGHLHKKNKVVFRLSNYSMDMQVTHFITVVYLSKLFNELKLKVNS